MRDCFKVNLNSDLSQLKEVVTILFITESLQYTKFYWPKAASLTFAHKLKDYTLIYNLFNWEQIKLVIKCYK